MSFCGLWMTHLGEREKPAPVPLTGVGVHVRIIDLVVSQFTADIDGRKITDVIKETSGAQADFLMAIRREQATAMAQEENADVFTVRKA